jgi:hypothetical protein
VCGGFTVSRIKSGCAVTMLHPPHPVRDADHVAFIVRSLLAGLIWILAPQQGLERLSPVDLHQLKHPHIHLHRYSYTYRNKV